MCVRVIGDPAVATKSFNSSKKTIVIHEKVRKMSGGSSKMIIFAHFSSYITNLISGLQIESPPIQVPPQGVPALRRVLSRRVLACLESGHIHSASGFWRHNLAVGVCGELWPWFDLSRSLLRGLGPRAYTPIVGVAVCPPDPGSLRRRPSVRFESQRRPGSLEHHVQVPFLELLAAFPLHDVGEHVLPGPPLVALGLHLPRDVLELPERCLAGPARCELRVQVAEGHVDLFPLHPADRGQSPPNVNAGPQAMRYLPSNVLGCLPVFLGGLLRPPLLLFDVGVARLRDR